MCVCESRNTQAETVFVIVSEIEMTNREMNVGGEDVTDKLNRGVFVSITHFSLCLTGLKCNWLNDSHF